MNKPTTRICPIHGPFKCPECVGDYQDDRVYLENERALDQRIDGCTARLAAA